MSAATPRITSCTYYGEARTREGQLVQFDASQEDIDGVTAAIERIMEIHLPESHPSNVGDGSYGEYSRYRITQHRYTGGRFGYSEAIEVHDAPSDRARHIIHRYDSHHGSEFWEFSAQAFAEAAFDEGRGQYNRTDAVLRQQAGFLRHVDCDVLTPWFYAVGNQELIGDFALPEHVQDDPFYRLGRRFVVQDEKGLPHIKTCIGSRRLEGSQINYYGRDPRLIVYWDDGSYAVIERDGRVFYNWDVDRGTREPPRPLDRGEKWIVEAINQFHDLLAGGRKQLKVQFWDGGKFVGRFIAADPSKESPAGQYFARVTFSGDQPARQGWFDFEPTADHPNVLSYLQSKLDHIASIEIVKSRPTAKHKKRWAGVFHSAPANDER